MRWEIRTGIRTTIATTTPIAFLYTTRAIRETRVIVIMVTMVVVIVVTCDLVCWFHFDA